MMGPGTSEERIGVSAGGRVGVFLFQTQFRK